LFASAALAVKRGNELGIDAWIATLVSNLATVAGFLCLWPMGGNFPGWQYLWQPAVAALLFVGGQWLAFLAFAHGEVSVATPILGVKIILVAAGVAILIGEPLGGRLWLAAAMSTLAVALLNYSDRTRPGRAGLTVLLAGGAAVCFALFDVLVQKWGPAWGAGRFLPVMMLFVAGISLVIHPFTSPHPLAPRPRAWCWVLAGGTLMALQSTIFITTILVYQNAASANVILSSRGLWSVALVWLVGHWFHSTEQAHGSSVLRWRLAGATLMSLAIALVVLK
jgi:drug/metabolite transporter (DMT)-like permease